MWHALNGTVLDVIGATEIPVPTQAAAVDACVKAIFENDLIKFAIQNAAPRVSCLRLRRQQGRRQVETHVAPLLARNREAARQGKGAGPATRQRVLQRQCTVTVCLTDRCSSPQ
jgi:hypothetical protein